MHCAGWEYGGEFDLYLPKLLMVEWLKRLSLEVCSTHSVVITVVQWNKCHIAMMNL